MAFNPYKKMIQKMMKAGKVFIQRDDADRYYVSDGCAPVSYTHLALHFQKLADLFADP